MCSFKTGSLLAKSCQKHRKTSATLNMQQERTKHQQWIMNNTNKNNHHHQTCATKWLSRSIYATQSIPPYYINMIFLVLECHQTSTGPFQITTFKSFITHPCCEIVLDLAKKMKSDMFPPSKPRPQSLTKTGVLCLTINTPKPAPWGMNIMSDWFWDGKLVVKCMGFMDPPWGT